MFKKSLFLVIVFVGLVIETNAQDALPKDTTIISIVNTDSTVKPQAPVETTADSSKGPFLRDTPASKRNYPKEVPEPDYTNYHPVKSTNNSTTEKLADASGIPADFAMVDTDHDGKISTKEIFVTIDNFFDGQSTFTVLQIRKLIDYFFDQ